MHRVDPGAGREAEGSDGGDARDDDGEDLPAGEAHVGERRDGAAHPIG